MNDRTSTVLLAFVAGATAANVERVIADGRLLFGALGVVLCALNLALAFKGARR